MPNPMRLLLTPRVRNSVPMPASIHPSLIRQARIGWDAAALTRAANDPDISSTLRLPATTALRRFAFAVRRAASFDAIGDSPNRMEPYCMLWQVRSSTPHDVKHPVAPPRPGIHHLNAGDG